MCKYCEELKSLYWDLDHDYIREVYIELDGSMSVTPQQCCYETYQGINIQINYCPMCGRKL